MSDFLEETIKKYEVAVGKAREVFDESTAMASRIRSGLERLDQDISNATTGIQTNEGNIIGSLVDDLTYDNTRFKEQVQTWEAEMDAHRRFLQRAPIVREELNRLAAECGEQIKNVEIVEAQLERLKEYRDLKGRLRETYLEQELFDMAVLEQQIASFEPELFEKNFLPFFAELKARNHGESRLLAIPVPDTGDADFEKFWRYWRYESLRYDLLSRKWSEDVTRGENLLMEMRILANALGSISGPLVGDYNDVFLSKLQTQNLGHNILNYRICF